MNEHLKSAPHPPAQHRDDLIQQLLDLHSDLGFTEFLISLPQASSSEAPTQSSDEQASNPQSITGLVQLRDLELGTCTRCKLHQRRKTIVFGEGNPSAQLMLIGEAPGADEDDQGRPFVGRAGQLLMQMIRAIQFERHDVYIANVIKCRPPNNRPPEPDEVFECSPFLWKQISIIRPKIILALGTFAAQTLLKSKSSITFLRNRVYEMDYGKVVATFHPSFLLRSPQKKPEAWEDLKLVRSVLQA